MKTQHFCVPIIKSRKSDVLQTIKKHKRQYDYFEVWLDYIEDLDVNFVKSLSKKLQDRLIVLFRRQKLEVPKMSKRLKIDILKSLDKSKTLVDLDIRSQKKDVNLILKLRLSLSLLLSYHNYTETPNTKTLQHILSEMSKYKPTIYKISTFCNKDSDAIRLLDILVTLKTQGKKSIVLGMGEHGIYTRICGMLLGNMFSFAPNTVSEASAPGQLTRHELMRIVKTLDRKFN